MSDSTLDQLIAKVKSEAIDSAEKEAKQIIEEAQLKAEQVLKNAQAEKEEMLSSAETEAKAMVDKGKLALQQAARDVHIAVKNDLLKVFKTVLEAEVSTSFTPDLYASVINKVIDTVGNNTTVALPAEFEEQIIDDIRKKVARSEDGFQILKDDDLFSVLSVTKTDEGWSYDITAEEVSELISQNLSRKWVDILNEE